ncbi:hypothetical protein NC661_01405 [Aquibacillus koreensis]|uniref:Uncharacterized protein n=1 Tax=Aquibacillus koreensis TaxID=279446 RepID=A0A9X4AI77_9BACI|nr:hypothetical protein [Aquibacillus koreensis]MCT2537587.1 hypothetical protein [Aquibacillus koreensis]MDC3419033.1 hypothetical protein [Aquibacillus koreensis]
MAEERKSIIIKEINNWKQANLLPSHYCDFLLALYTEGNVEQEQEKKERTLLERLFFICISLSNFLLLPLTLLVIYFTEMNFTMQILLVIIFLILTVCYYLYFKKDHMLNDLYASVIMLLIFLVITVYITNYFFSSYTFIIIAGHCLFWIALGIRKKLIFLTIFGVLGGVMLIIYNFI